MTDMRLLPVWQNRDRILREIEANQVIIVESPTGSGKTTQIPLILHEAGFSKKGMIGITQPRRIATLGVCSYIKNQLQDNGALCGYKMRFYDTTGPDTKIKILTDGMLLQEMKTDPDLSAYSVIMVDEAHERSLNIDFILGLLRQICQRRPEFKVIISSATLNTKVFAKYFNAPVIKIEARQFNVQIKYLPLREQASADELYYSICRTINRIVKDFVKHGKTESRDTLVFLPGEFEIKTCLAMIYENCDYSILKIYPLYGRLGREEQEQVFEPTPEGRIKVVLATNIAETSLTIDGIRAVIDSGLARINSYNQYDCTSSLVTRPISRSSADQRAGRAGRTADGECYRLYSRDDFLSRPRYTQEEILRTDLCEVVLRMVDLGIKDFEAFPYITRPDPKAIKSGEQTLRLIGATDEGRNLTSTGRLMVRYPLLPRHSRCMVQAVMTEPDLVPDIAVCVSFLSCRSPYLLPAGQEDAARACHRKFSSEYGDFLGCQILYRRYTAIEQASKREEFCKDNCLDFQCMEEIVHVARQLCDITREMGIPVIERNYPIDADFARRCLVCLCSGLVQYICMKKKGVAYRTLTADEIHIHPGSAWFRNPPRFILAGEIVLTTKLYARTVSPLNGAWINQAWPGLAEKLEKQAARAAGTDNRHNGGAREEEGKSREKKKSVTIYGFALPVVYEGGKKDRAVAIIDFSVLPQLERAYRRASRHPHGVASAILFKGRYLGWGEKLSENLALAGRVGFSDQDYVEKLPGDVFFTDNLHVLSRHLNILMKLSPLAKYKDRLGFVELVSSGGGMFFHVNRYFSEALNNTAYCLLSITDSGGGKEFARAYNRIVKLLD